MEIGSDKSLPHTLTYKDENGTNATITLNKGVADVYFDGAGTVGADIKNTINVAGSHLRPREIALSSTTTSSVLKMTGFKKGQLNLGGISDSFPLGSINAPTTNLQAVGSANAITLGTNSHTLTTDAVETGVPIAAAGTIQLAGVKSISLLTANTANIILGGSGVKSSAITFTGNVTDTQLTSTVPLSTLKAKAWLINQLQVQLISVPSISTLSITGAFDPDLTLTSAGKVTDLGSVKIGGAVAVGSWTAAGNVKTVSIASSNASWGGLDVTGNLSSLTVKGNLSADVVAGTISTLKVGGILSSDIVTTGNVSSITAAQMVGALIDVGSTANSISDASLSNVGLATLKSIKVTSKALNSFSDTSVVAYDIGSFTTGPVNAASTSPEGLAAHIIKSASVNVNGAAIKFSGKTIASDAAVQTYLNSKGKTLGTFAIDLLTAELINR